MQFKSPTYQLTNSLSTSFALCGEAEVDNVAVADDVVFAFEPDLTVIAARGHRAARDQTVVADHFRANEPPRDVAVNLAGGGLCGRVARNRPGAALVFVEAHQDEGGLGGKKRNAGELLQSAPFDNRRAKGPTSCERRAAH